jgi:hypothetical protein
MNYLLIWENVKDKFEIWRLLNLLLLCWTIQFPHFDRPLSVA